MPGSCFIDEYTFALFEGIFEQQIRDFNHYAFTEVAREDWLAIRTALQALRVELAANGQRFPAGVTLQVADLSAQDMRRNATLLAQLLGELDQWLEVQLRTHDSIALLGI